MDIFPILYFIPFFIYLYWVFFFVKDDFILLRKNISADQLFSLSIIGVFVVFLFSRLGFVILHPKFIYANPLVFLAFPYYPGFSQAGGIIGIYFYLWLYTKRKKIPFLRTFDIIVSALAQAVWVGSFLDFFVQVIIYHIRYFNFIFSGCLLLVWAVIIAYIYSVNKFKDGSIGYMGLAGVSLILLLSFVFSNIFFLHRSIFLIENALLAFLFLGFLVMFVRNEFKKGK